VSATVAKGASRKAKNTAATIVSGEGFVLRTGVFRLGCEMEGPIKVLIDFNAYDIAAIDNIFELDVCIVFRPS
jgi:hypothetical protein